LEIKNKLGAHKRKQKNFHIRRFWQAILSNKICNALSRRKTTKKSGFSRKRKSKDVFLRLTKKRYLGIQFSNQLKYNTLYQQLM
jgi:hypothetical protein